MSGDARKERFSPFPFFRVRSARVLVYALRMETPKPTASFINADLIGQREFTMPLPSKPTELGTKLATTRVAKKSVKEEKTETLEELRMRIVLRNTRQNARKARASLPPNEAARALVDASTSDVNETVDRSKSPLPELSTTVLETQSPMKKEATLPAEKTPKRPKSEPESVYVPPKESRPYEGPLPTASELFATNPTGKTPLRPASHRRGRAVVPENRKKLFVLDTNVLLHDPRSLFRFAEHDVFLPMTTLEEIDNHKVGTSEVARNGRSISRTLDALLEAHGGAVLAEGLSLSALGNTEAQGKLYFETHPMAAPLPPDLPSNKGDNRILAVVSGLASYFPEHVAVLVTKDVNMRIKATTLGLPAEDYFSDKVLDDTDLLFPGIRKLVDDFWLKVADTLETEEREGVTLYRFRTATPGDFVVNEILWIPADVGTPFMARVTNIDGTTVTIAVLTDYTETGEKLFGIHARNIEQNAALNLILSPDIDFVSLLGQAGTGKTLMSLAAAFAMTIDRHQFDEILVTRATVSVGEDIGYLPGTEEEKMVPWMGGIYDNLDVLAGTKGMKAWEAKTTRGVLEQRLNVKSMSLMRGRTFHRKFVLIDEAQNLTPKEMRTLITRAGPGTKIVCLGNLAQIDTPYLTEGSSGLTYVVERFLGWEHAATLTLSRGERSRLAEFATDVL